MHRIKFIILSMVIIWLLAGSIAFGENPWSVKINIPEFKLYLYHSGEVYQTFSVAVGKLDSPSPLGEFWIVNKVIDPTWYPTDGRPPVLPGPDNPLGKYWLGLNVEGYGIHGNSAAWSIGNPISLGCFRMHNKDIQKIFEIVPVGTPVEIIYETVRTNIDDYQQAWLEVLPDIYNLEDQENAIQQSLQNLNWKYQPHQKALGELLKKKKPFKVEIPRMIKIEGESKSIDGFFWNNQVYIDKDYLKFLPVAGSFFKETPVFEDYLKLENGNTTNETYRLIWDQENNTLKILRLKVFLNGAELTNAGKWSNGQRLLVDLNQITRELGTSFSWDLKSPAAVCHGIVVPGEGMDGVFWVEYRQLNEIWPGMLNYWDGDSWVLNLETPKHLY